MTKTAIFLILCLIASNSYSKGIFGSYAITGKAYDKSGVLIKNDKITVEFNGERKNVETDSLGNYTIGIGYATACPSVFRGLKRRKANKKMNPKFIVINYNDQEIVIKNKWRKYVPKRRRYLDLHFE
jgi:hypothetical protein